MTAQTTADELRAAAERAAVRVRDALLHHAEVMSEPAVRYSAVADADDAIVEALRVYGDAAERITGLSVLLRVPLPDDGGESDRDPLPEATLADHEVGNGPLVLEARWYFEQVRSGSVERILGSSGEADAPEGGTADALAELFERDVVWPPPEYTDAGLIVSEMEIAVYPPAAD